MHWFLSFLYTRNLHAYCDHDFSKDFPDLLNNPTVLEVAKKHGKAPAQILLRHIVQRGIAAIPKSTNPERINQNLQVRFNILSYIPVYQCILNSFLIPSAFWLHSGYSSSQRPTDQSVWTFIFFPSFLTTEKKYKHMKFSAHLWISWGYSCAINVVVVVTSQNIVPSRQHWNATWHLTVSVPYPAWSPQHTT